MNGSVARRFLLGLAPWVGAVALWYGVRWSGFVNASLIPAPHQVAAKFVELLLQKACCSTSMLDAAGLPRRHARHRSSPFRSASCSAGTGRRAPSSIR